MKRIFSLLPIFVVFGCGLFSKKQDEESSNSPPKTYAASYLSFAESLKRLKDLDVKPKNLSNKLTTSWLWQNLHANLSSLTPDQRDVLKNYLRKPSSPENSLRFMFSELATPEAEKFNFKLDINQSIRIPVKSFCLDSHRNSPSQTTRFVLDSITNESLVRQILFKFLESQENHALFQGLMWDLEDLNRPVAHVPKFAAVLQELNFQFDPNETLLSFQKRDSTRDRSEQLKIGVQSFGKEGVEASLVASNGYHSGELVITNRSNSPLDLDASSLNLRMSPTQDLSEYNVSDPANASQRIYVSGANPNEVQGQIDKQQKLASDALRLNERLSEYKTNSRADAKTVEFLDHGFRYLCDLLAQGELDAGANILSGLSTILEKITQGLDIATALTPGLNDLRDLYEFAVGKDLISGAQLTAWERALSGLGLVAGSGIVMRKGINSLARATRVEEEVYKTTHSIIEQVGREGKNGKTVLGHYPAYVEKANELGAKRFNIPEQIWEKMPETEKWAANQKFLDRAIARSDEIVLATAHTSARPNSFFAKELEYLKTKGYRVSPDGRTMKK